MRYFILLLLFSGCAPQTEIIDISRDLEQINKDLVKNSKKLECLIRIENTDFKKLIKHPCIEDLACVRKYIDNFEQKCLNN